jgi:hypothetical protein
MHYSQQSSAPEWFQSDKTKIYESATMGSSPFNEWYEFDDRKDAIDCLAAGNNQSFVDDFEVVGDEIYRNDDLEWNEDADSLTVTKGAKPASLSSIVSAQSRF